MIDTAATTSRRRRLYVAPANTRRSVRKLSERARRRIVALTAKIDTLATFDAAWLVRHGRRYRLRPSHAAELERHALMRAGAVEPLGEGCKHLTIVADMGRGWRNHLLVTVCAGLNGDPGDSVLELLVSSLMAGGAA